MSYLDSYARDVVSGAINIRDVPLQGHHVETVFSFFVSIMAEIVAEHQKLRSQQVGGVGGLGRALGLSHDPGEQG